MYNKEHVHWKIFEYIISLSFSLIKQTAMCLELEIIHKQFT